MQKTKKRLFPIIAGIFVLLFAVSLSACDKKTKSFKLTFETDGGTQIPAITAEAGADIGSDLPDDPEKTGYVFKGWYLDEGFSGEAVELPDKMPEQDITYYAKFEKLATLSLQTSQGVLTQNSYELGVGDNLQTFLADKSPSADGLIFGGWFYADGRELAATDTIPDGGVTLNAKWKVEYSVDFYLENIDGTYPEKPQTEKRTSWFEEPLEFSEEIEHFALDVEAENNKLSVESLNKGETIVAYYKRDTYIINYYANAPEGETPKIDHVTRTIRYEEVIELEAIDEFGISIKYRVIGYAPFEGGELMYKVGEPFETEYNVNDLYAVWEVGYANAFDSTDYVFVSEDETKVYLHREGLPEKQGTIDANKFFSFTFDDGTVLKGRINGQTKTFSFISEELAGTYSSLINYAGISLISKLVSIEINAYDEMIVYYHHLDDDGDELWTETIAEGFYSLDKEWGIPHFEATTVKEEYKDAYGSFNFAMGVGQRLDENGNPIEQINYFIRQGAEAGNYMTLEGSRYTLPGFILDGLGNFIWYQMSSAGAQQAIQGMYIPTNIMDIAEGKAYQPEDEFEMYTWSDLQGWQLNFTLKVTPGKAYDVDGNEIDLGTFQIREDALKANYNYEVKDEEGNVTETQRWAMDGYGSGKFGTVTKDEDGNEVFTPTKEGTYSISTVQFVQEYYDDEDGSYDYTSPQRVILSFTFEDGSAERWLITRLASTDFWTGTPIDGTMSPLADYAGVHTLANPFTKIVNKEYDNDYAYIYTSVQYLYLHGAAGNFSGYGALIDNYAELWGDMGNGYQVLYSYGSVEVKKDEKGAEVKKNGLTVYTYTQDNGASRYGKDFDTTFDFVIDGEGNVVRVNIPTMTFEASDGVTIVIDDSGVAKKGAVTVDYTTTSISMGSSSSAVMGVMYDFYVSSDTIYSFFTYTEGGEEKIRELDNDKLYSEAGTDHSAQQIPLNISSILSFKPQKDAEASDATDCLYLYYSYNSRYEEYQVYPSSCMVGSYALDAEQGENVYKMTKKIGGGSSSFYFTFFGEKEFVKQNTSSEFKAQQFKLVGSEEGGDTLSFDGYIGFTYVSGGKTVTGTYRVITYSYNRPKRSTGSGNTTWLTIEGKTDDGTLYYFEICVGDSDFRVMTPQKDILVGFDKYYYFDRENGSVDSTNTYYYDGEYILFYNANAGLFNGKPQVYKITAKTETSRTDDYTIIRVDPSNDYNVMDGAEERHVGFRKITSITGKEWNVLIDYLPDMDFNYDLVDNDGNKIGNVNADGYEVMNYTDAEGNVTDFRNLKITVDGEVITVLVANEEGYLDNEKSFIFDVINQNGKMVGWKRTSVAADVWQRNNETLLDLCIVMDGHGNAKLWKGEMNDNERVYIDEGKVYVTEGITWKYESEKFNFVFDLYVVNDDFGNVLYYFYLEYFENYDRMFACEENWTSLLLDGKDGAVYYDERGTMHEGTYAVLGDNKTIIQFYSEDVGYIYYNNVRGSSKLELIDSAFAVEGGVLWGYQGGAIAGRVPEGVDTIAERAFYGRTQLEKIDLTGVKYIDARAFAGCTNLAKITGSENVEYIGEQAFAGCSSLPTMPLDNLKTLATYAFSQCYLFGSEHVNMPKIERIEAYAFYYCLGMQTISFGPELAYIGDEAFFNVNNGTTANVGGYDRYTHVFFDFSKQIPYFGSMIQYQCEAINYAKDYEQAKKFLESPQAKMYRTTAYYDKFSETLAIGDYETFAARGTVNEYGYWFNAKDLSPIRLTGLIRRVEMGHYSATYPVKPAYQVIDKVGGDEGEKTLKLVWFEYSDRNNNEGQVKEAEATINMNTGIMTLGEDIYYHEGEVVYTNAAEGKEQETLTLTLDSNVVTRNTSNYSYKISTSIPAVVSWKTPSAWSQTGTLKASTSGDVTTFTFTEDWATNSSSFRPGYTMTVTADKKFTVTKADIIFKFEWMEYYSTSSNSSPYVTYFAYTATLNEDGTTYTVDTYNSTSYVGICMIKKVDNNQSSSSPDPSTFVTTRTYFTNVKPAECDNFRFESNSTRLTFDFTRGGKTYEIVLTFGYANHSYTCQSITEKTDMEG